MSLYFDSLTNVEKYFHRMCVKELKAKCNGNVEEPYITETAMAIIVGQAMAFSKVGAPDSSITEIVNQVKAEHFAETNAAKIKAEQDAKASDPDEKYILVDTPLNAGDKPASTVTGKSDKPVASSANPAKVRKMRKLRQAPVSVNMAKEFNMSDELYDALVEIMLELRKDLGRFKKDDLPAMDICSVRINMFMISLLGKIESDAKIPWNFYLHYALPQALEEFDAMSLNEESFVAKKSDFEFIFVDDAFMDLFCERMVNIMLVAYLQNTPTAIAEAEQTIYDAIERMLAVKVKGTYDIDLEFVLYTEQVMETVKTSAEKLKQRVIDCAEFLLQTVVNGKNGKNAVSHVIAEAPKSAVYQPASTSYGQISANPTPIPYKPAVQASKPAVQASKPAVQAAKPNGRPRKSNKPVLATNTDASKSTKEADEQKFKYAPWIVTNTQTKNTVDFIPELYKYDPVTFNQASSVMEFFDAQDKTHVMNLFDSEVLRNIINGLVLQNKKQGLRKSSVLRIDVQPGTVFVVNVPNGPGKVKEVTLLLGDLWYIWNMQVTRYVHINRISEGTEQNKLLTEQLRNMFVVHAGTDARYIELFMYSP